MAMATAAIMNPTPAMAMTGSTSRIGCDGNEPPIAPHDLRTGAMRKKVPSTRKIRRPIMEADVKAKGANHAVRLSRVILPWFSENSNVPQVLWIGSTIKGPGHRMPVDLAL